ncbi:MAG: hypothetical protein ACRDCF_01575 [Mycoplasmoidaceae bacterium]
MNKKVKMTLLSLMLGASIAGIATTIVSCSASSTNEIKIEYSSTLISNVTKDLTQFFEKNESYKNKIDAYNNILNKNILPESTLSILKKEITFKNDGNTIAWDDAVTGLEITGPSFTQVGNGDIEPISIKLLINSSFVVHGSSVNNVTFKTGTLGNVGIIPIFALTEQNKQFEDQLSSALDAILDSKKTYQEMKQTYDNWIADPFKNLPKSILDMFRNNFRFETGAGIALFFDNIVENLEFVSKTSYPSEPYKKIPDFKITIKLKNDGYIFTNPEQEEILTIENIVINSQTKLIDTSIDNVNNTNIEKAFLDYLNPNSDAIVYQEVREKFNDMIEPNGIIPDSIKNAIIQNIQLNLFGYKPIPSFDDIIATVKIETKGEFPKTSNTSLPSITINFTLKPNFQSLDDSVVRPIDVNLSRIKSGRVKYEVVINSNLEEMFRNQLYSSLKTYATWQGMQKEYDQNWSSFDKLPLEAQKIVKDNISFKPIGLNEGDVDLGIDDLTSFDDIINNISFSKGKFPKYGEDIDSIDLELSMIDSIFYVNNSGDNTNKIQITSGVIGVANRPILINVDEKEFNNVSNKIQESISKDFHHENKKIYESLNSLNDFDSNIIEAIEKSFSSTYPETFRLNDIVESSTIDKSAYPTTTDTKIDKFSIEITLKEKFLTQKNDRKISIDLSGLMSRGKYQTKIRVKGNVNQTVEEYFTNFLNDQVLLYLVPAAGTPEQRLVRMRSNYTSISSSSGFGMNKIKEALWTHIEYLNMSTNSLIPISSTSQFDSYFSLTTIIGAVPDSVNDKFPPVTIKITFKDNNFVWPDNTKTLQITTSPLKSALENIPPFL